MDATDVNLTPLLDVVFVVLIMFIIIAPLLELDRVQLASGPNSQEKEMTSVQQKSPLTIHVKENNAILLNGKALVIAQLREHLRVLHTRNSRVVPQLFQDKKAAFGTYQEVKNAVEEAGFEELDIILKPS